MSYAANIGGDDIPRGVVTMSADMAAYDALPEVFRRELGEMAVNWNASRVQSLIGAHGADVTLRVLRKTEADMQAAARQRVMACVRS